MTGMTRTREAELSFQLHRAVLPFLEHDWPTNRRIILKNLAFLNSRPRSELARSWVSSWEHAVARGPQAVAEVALTEGERGDDLRQVTPLAGVLPEEERLRVIRRVRGLATV